MRILIVNNSKIPAFFYGGTERVIWALGKELAELGHQVVYLVAEGSFCSFAEVVPIDTTKSIIDQIPDTVDIVHFNFIPQDLDQIRKPYIITMHGNPGSEILDANTVFVSRDHARRYGSDVFVYNGLDWQEYGQPELTVSRSYFHFLGKAAWRVKNVKGAINVVSKTKHEKLNVLGGKRFNFKMGIRLTISPRVTFFNKIGGDEKNKVLQHSKGLIFPVRWHEPFGLAIIESLYFGCPVFGTPYGSLPELVGSDFGFLSSSSNELASAIMHSTNYSSKKCHEYAQEMFNSKKMCQNYLHIYEVVLSGQSLNKNKPQLQESQPEKFLVWS